MFNKKIGAGFEILTLILATIAFAYIISYDTKVVSGQGPPTWGCCKKLNNGAYCLETTEDKCEEGFSPYVNCIDSADCKLGCCLNKNNGECNVRTPKTVCTEQGGEWCDNEECNILVCRRGCCILGSQTQFVTEKTCELLSNSFGLQKDFRRNIVTEFECVMLAYATEEGACVYTSQGLEACQYITMQECNRIPNSRFELGKFCSDELPNVCRKHEGGKRCVSGKDPVYWFDSCGNREEVAEQCDRFTGTTCGLNENGEAYCKSLDCKNIPVEKRGPSGKSERKNGESWCVYESQPGEDIPGTSHYKYYCLDGEVKMERCLEGRAAICTESNIIGQDQTTFSQASCVLNLAINCINLNVQRAKGEITITEFEEKCSQNPHCEIISFAGDMNPSLTFCAPKYPRGFLNLDQSEEATGFCSMGTYRCTRIDLLKLNWNFEWEYDKCLKGCDCAPKEGGAPSQSLQDKANKMCRSMGDCGAYVSLANVHSDNGFKITKNTKEYERRLGGPGGDDGHTKDKGTVNIAQNLPWENYKANLQPEHTIPPGDFSALIEAQTGRQEGYTLPPVSQKIEMPEGGYFLGIKWSGWNLNELDESEQAKVLWWGNALGWGGGSWLLGESGTTGGAAFWEVFSGAILGGLIGYYAGNLVINGFGLDKYMPPGWEDFLVFAATGLGVGAGITYAVSSGATAAATAWAAFGIGMAIILTIALIVALIGIRAKIYTYTFECKPWQPPLGGANCNLCNDIPERCTEYKCKSLGQACDYIQEGEVGKCIEINPGDVIPPKIIGPWQQVLETSNLSSSEQSESGFRIMALDENQQEMCIEQFSLKTFGIQTDEISYCKYDFKHTDSYDNMAFDFDGGWNMNHSITTRFSDQQKGDLSIYVRCSDRRGNKNPTEYIIRTCITEYDRTAPILLNINPVSRSYLAYGQTSKYVEIRINEDAGCSWSLTDKPYELMENNFTCGEPIPIGAFEMVTCNTTVTGLTQGENHVYIKCKDWSNNTNTESLPSREGLILYKSLSPLSVSVTEPMNNADLVFGNEINVQLRAETSGGVDGKADCSYSFSGFNTMVPFFRTGDTQHTQQFNAFIPGEKTIYVKCRDIAGNEANTTVTFKVSRDITPPTVTRVYNKDSSLYIETNEDATCKYTHVDCNFEFEDGDSMIGSEKEHTIPWKIGKKYYIKCMDNYGNRPDKCSIVVSATSVE